MEPRNRLAPPDDLIANLHMAKFLHAELHQAFEELGRGNLQTRADMLAIRAGQVDGVYESLWDHLKLARGQIATLGRSTAAYDDAVAALGPIGTRLGVLDATNTFGMSPTIGAGGVGIRAGGVVGAHLNYDGARVAKRVFETFIEALPEVDWSKAPPPRAPVRPAVPDIQLVDDGSPTESVRPPRRAAFAFWAVAAIGAAAAVLLLVMASRGNSRSGSDEPARRPSAKGKYLDIDELLALDSKKLGDVLQFGELPDDVMKPARAELERRYLAELPRDALPEVIHKAEVADTIDMGAPVFTAAAQRIVGLGATLEDLAKALTDDTSPRLRTELGPLLAPQLAARLPAVASVADGLELFELSIRLGEHPPTQQAIGARIAELARGNLDKLDLDTFDTLWLDQEPLGLPDDLVAALQAESERRASQ